MEDLKKEIIIDGIKVTEGEKYKHNKTGVIYEVKRDYKDVLKFNNGVIKVDVTKERLQKVTKVD